MWGYQAVKFVYRLCLDYMDCLTWRTVGTMGEVPRSAVFIYDPLAFRNRPTVDDLPVGACCMDPPPSSSQLPLPPSTAAILPSHA